MTRRLFVRRSDIRVAASAAQRSLFEPVRIELFGIGTLLSERLAAEPSLVHTLSPGEFEAFICERLFAMGLEPVRVGSIFEPDGGIDIVFWPRRPTCFPFLGAVQVKHHKSARRREGAPTVRQFAGSLVGRPFSAGMVVTNTSFTAGAEWFAKQQHGLIRLRGFSDIQRWLANNFTGEEEWRELPTAIELAPGIIVQIRGRPRAG